jgi:hypothetical protein
MERLRSLCDETSSSADFEARLTEAAQSDDAGTVLLAAELLALWQTVAAGGSQPPVQTES